MICVITECKDEVKTKHWIDLGYVVNQTVKAADQSKTWHQVNWSLILNKRTKIVIFDLDAYYPDTKSLIYGALKNARQVIIMQGRTRTNLTSLNDMDIVTKIFKQAREMYFEDQDVTVRHSNLLYAKQQAEKLGIELLEQEHMKNFVQLNAREHDMCVDYSDNLKIILAYTQIMWYNMNNLPAMNTENKLVCPVCGHHTLKEFDGSVPQCYYCGSELPEEELEDSITYFGDMNFLDDIVYQAHEGADE